MTQSSTDAFKEFISVEDGLTFAVRIYQKADGSFEAKVTVLEGSADFNAFYFGDAIDDGSSVNLKGSLNMSGAGSVENDGNHVDWDDAVVLSKPGLGPQGADKPTYLSEGESFSFPLDIASLDEVHAIGFRATSTSTPEGSIKSVLEPVDPDPVEVPPADEPEVAQDDEPVSAAETVDTAKMGDGSLDTLSDQAYFETIASLVGTVAEDEPPADIDATGEDFQIVL